jgi:hypothetical protein
VQNTYLSNELACSEVEFLDKTVFHFFDLPPMRIRFMFGKIGERSGSLPKVL